jgi:hypothetical protein
MQGRAQDFKMGIQNLKNYQDKMEKNNERARV